MLTEFAWLRLEATLSFMLFVILLCKLYLTVLAYDLSMRLLIMFLLFCLGNDLPADSALVVHASAAHLMHPVLALLDISAAHATLFRWLSCFHFFAVW